MPVRALINKEVIPFVCKGKKVTIDYIHSITKYTPEQLSRWTDPKDTALPTIRQAKAIAHCLHLPFASLYMNTEHIKLAAIPSIKNYRTLFGACVTDDSSLNLAICDVLQERDYLISQREELHLPIASVPSLTIYSDSPVIWAEEIREHFQIKVSDQFKLNSARQFYLYLRGRLERFGYFVQCFSNVPIEVARGFSIYYSDRLPIIALNENDRPPAKSFSLIHELTHLLKRESTVCNAMYNSFDIQAEEVFCNAVAGELLVPSASLDIVLGRKRFSKPYSTDDIRIIANSFSVSREVIIRRLLDTQKITKAEYDTYSYEYAKEIALEKEAEKEERKIAKLEGRNAPGPRPNISRDTFDRTSLSVSTTLHYGYNEGFYSKAEIAHHLGIAQKHVDKFLLEVSKWNN